MPNVKFVAGSGDAYVDGLMSGRAWNASTLTFSFPASASFYGSGYGDGEPYSGFQAFNAAQQSATKAVLAQVASVVRLDFAAVTETASTHGDLRFAETSRVSTAWGYYPSTDPEGGDTWYSASGTYDSPRLGNYAWLTLLHEIGHALGLKHPHEASGAFGAQPADRDSLEYTVMSYRSDVGAAADYYRNGSSSYPQTLMMLDIAALQKMYGADYSTNAGDTVYRWSPTTGQMFVDGVGQAAPIGNKIFMTVWDGGGSDTFDFSAYTGALAIDLAPGAWSTVSTAQLADLGNGAVAVGNIANALLHQGNAASLIENAVGGSGNDTIAGNAGANRLTGGRGNDVLDGRGGTDIAVFSGRAEDYAVAGNADGSWTVADLRTGRPDGTDTLWNIEYMLFSDGRVAAAPEPASDTTPVLVIANSAPTAVEDAYFVRKNTKLKVADAGLLANDRDDDGDAIAATLVSGPRKGKVKVADDGSFVFKAPKGFTGKVKFKYAASDGDGTSASAKVVMTVLNKKAYAKALASEKAGIGEHLDLDAIPPALSDYATLRDTGPYAASPFGSGSAWLASGPDWLHHRTGPGLDLHA